MFQILMKKKQGAWLNLFTRQIYLKWRFLKNNIKGLPKATVYRIFKKIRESGAIDRRPGSGRKKLNSWPWFRKNKATFEGG